MGQPYTRTVLTAQMEIVRHRGEAWRAHPCPPSLLHLPCSLCGIRDVGIWQTLNVHGRVHVVHTECVKNRMVRLAKED